MKKEAKTFATKYLTMTTQGRSIFATHGGRQKMAHSGGISSSNGHGTMGGLGQIIGAPPLPPSAKTPTLNAGIFPLKMVIEFPFAGGTADCGIYGTAEDNLEYALKDGVSNNSAPTVPHCEWFCSELAVAVHVGTPEHHVIERLDGSIVFGSQWVGGVISPSNAVLWEDMVTSGTIPLADISIALSHIFAFDQFIYNDDRHAGNFLAFKQHTKWAVKAFDYSRAWLFHGFPPPAVPLPLSWNTVEQHRRFVSKWGSEYIDPAEVDITLDKLRNVPTSKIQGIIDQHPLTWLQAKQKSDIIDWWNSSERLNRLNEISSGVRNGSCY